MKKARRAQGGKGKDVLYVKAAACTSQIGVLVASDEVEKRSGKGCTKADAERDLDRKLLDLAVQARRPVGQCEDATCDTGDCILFIRFLGNWELQVSPARLRDCPDQTGYVCKRVSRGTDNFMQCLCGCFV
jgi:hypothetical protein